MLINLYIFVILIVKHLWYGCMCFKQFYNKIHHHLNMMNYSMLIYFLLNTNKTFIINKHKRQILTCFSSFFYCCMNLFEYSTHTYTEIKPPYTLITRLIITETEASFKLTLSVTLRTEWLFVVSLKELAYRQDVNNAVNGNKCCLFVS